ncbi:MAG: hypothetical protein ABIR83_02690 [Nakamurella sp.]
MVTARKVVLATLIAALSVLGVSPAGAATAPGDPLGALDSVVRTAEPGYRFVVTGWASGTTDGPGYGRVAVYVDSVGVLTNTLYARPDVAAYLGVNAGADNRFGYVAGVDASPGTHRICAYAIGGTNPLLGCRTVTVAATAPRGNLDAVTSALEPGFVDVRGWAVGTAGGTVAVYVDGTRHVLPTVYPREDVAVALGIRPAGGATDVYIGFGFDGAVPVPAGSHRVCVYALGGTNPLLGCRTADVPGSPNAVVDTVTLTTPFTLANLITITGWAYDPAAPALPGQVAVYVRTLMTPQVVFAGATDIERTDVQIARNLPQAVVGFQAQVAFRSGMDAVCDIWIYQVVQSGVNPLFYHYSTDASLELSGAVGGVRRCR